MIRTMTILFTAAGVWSQEAPPKADPQVAIGQIASDPQAAPGTASTMPRAEQVDPFPGRDLLATPSPNRDRERRPVQQLTGGKPSADAAPALSDSRQSIPLASEALAGNDRCDPVSGDRLFKAQCARVIENRGAEFDRTPVPLSPEQRLLLEQRVTQREPGALSASRRLAGPNSGDLSLEDQAVASVALRPATPPVGAREEEKDQAGLTQEQAAAIVGAILNPPTPR